MKLRSLAVATLVAAPAFSQLAAPNAAGVAMGHVHIKTSDMDAQRKFWIEGLGGRPGTLGRMASATFPGVVVLWEKGDHAGGTVGSTVNHVGFHVRSLKDTLAKTQAAGARIDTSNDKGAFLFAPDDVRVEVVENPGQTEPAVFHHVHFFVPATKDVQAWYVKTFDAKAGRRANFDAADLPGVNLTFTEAQGAAPVGTQGRALDHIGFEVRNLEAFAKKLEAEGVKFTIPYRKIDALGIAIAFFTDPFGTYVELTEGLGR